MRIGEKIREYIGYAEEGAHAVFLPGVNHTAITCYYALARRLPVKIEILPDKKNDTFTSSILKGGALFVSGFALHCLAFLGTIWYAWGTGTNTLFFLVFELVGKRNICGIEKIQVINNIRACLIQAIFDFSIYYFSWWYLGGALASQIITCRLAAETGIVECVQRGITALIEKCIQKPPGPDPTPGQRSEK